MSYPWRVRRLGAKPCEEPFAHEWAARFRERHLRTVLSPEAAATLEVVNVDARPAQPEATQLGLFGASAGGPA